MNLVTDEQGNSTRLFSSRDSSQAGPGNSLTFTSQEVEVYNFRFNSENRAKKNLISFNVTEGRFVVGATKPVTRITGEIKGDLDSLISGGVVILSNLPVSSDNLVFSINDSSGTQTLEQGFFMVESLKLVPFYSLSNKREGQFIDWSIRMQKRRWFSARKGLSMRFRIPTPNLISQSAGRKLKAKNCQTLSPTFLYQAIIIMERNTLPEAPAYG